MVKQKIGPNKTGSGALDARFCSMVFVVRACHKLVLDGLDKLLIFWTVYSLSSALLSINFCNIMNLGNFFGEKLLEMPRIEPGQLGA